MKRWNLNGRTAVVTGAAGGLGAALCHRLAQRGCRVGGLDVDGDGLKRLVDRCRHPGRDQVATEICELTDTDAVLHAVDRLRSRLGPVDLAIANAGITHLRPFGAGESEAVRRVMEVNFLGAVHVMDACFTDLVERRGFAVAISSVAGYAPLAGRTAYSASKHAMHGFFDTLRCELRSTGAGVLIVCPSFIATGIRRGQPGEAKARVVGREETPEQVARQVVDAIERRRRFLATGRVGRLARLLHRFSPRLYETMMLRRADLEAETGDGA